MREGGATRREFLRTVAVAGVALGVGSQLSGTMAFTETPGREEFGQCKSVKIKCISRVGWIDRQKLLKDMGASGGMRANQWRINWDPSNSSGCCNLAEIETLDEKKRKFFIDTG
jgi:hypothetical protein